MAEDTARGFRYPLWICHACGYRMANEADDLCCDRCGEGRKMIEHREVVDAELADYWHDGLDALKAQHDETLAALAQERERARELENDNRSWQVANGWLVWSNGANCAKAEIAERQRDELVEAAKRLVYGRVDDRWDNEKALRRLLSRISHS